MQLDNYRLLDNLLDYFCFTAKWHFLVPNVKIDLKFC